MQNKRVAVGMSGGVDSSVAAAMLAEQGYEVTGVFIEAYNDPSCRTDQDKRDALKVATKLGIRFQILDVRKEYKEKVIKYFADEYAAGRTPNPDVVCNREVKFGIFYEWAMNNGFESVATGHYARIVGGEWLARPQDLTKDQTYWLWQVQPDKLKHIIFPLGELTKKEVRQKASELRLPNAEKPDSMGVCMMGELDVASWLKQRLGEKPGEVLWQGRVVGQHRGLWYATVGQRGGWTINPEVQTPSMQPLYVVNKNTEHNQLIVGTREECSQTQFCIEGFVRYGESNKCWVRVRNLGELYEVKNLSDGEVETVEPIFAPAPGQSAVLYDEIGRVVGGAIIGSCN